MYARRAAAEGTAREGRATRRRGKRRRTTTPQKERERKKKRDAIVIYSNKLGAVHHRHDAQSVMTTDDPAGG